MSYSSLHRHASMVFDEVRNRAYFEAMRRVITPASIVLDVGAGVGVLGLLAAKLGARKVYCVEPSPVVEHIPALARANGVADRVVALRGRIEDVELPEQVDVLLSVFTGNLLFTEGLMPSLYQARDKHLKPGGTMIPDRARLLFAGVEAPEKYASTAGRYRNTSLDIDYSPIADAVANGVFVMERSERAPLPITPGIIATELDLRSTLDDRIKWSATVHAERDGLLHGLIGWIEIHLGEAWLSTAPDRPGVHWRPVLLPVASPVPIRKGQAVELGFQFIDEGQLAWSIATGEASQRQATLLGNRDVAIDVMLSTAACSNPLGQEGEFVARALAAMREGKSNQVIAEELQAAMPQCVRDRSDALKRVGALSARYRMHPLRKA